MWNKPIRTAARMIVWVVVMTISFNTLQFGLAQEDATTRYKQVLKQLYEKAVSSGQLDFMDALYTPDYVNHGFGDDLDVKGFKAFLTAWRSALADFKITPEVIIAEKQWAASRVIFSGTFDRQWALDEQIIQPNHKPIQLAFNILHRFNDNGQIAEDFTAFDRLSLLLQMDAAPPLPGYIASTLVTGKIEPIIVGEPVSQNKEAFHKQAFGHVIDDSLNKGDLTAIDKYMAEDYLTHEPFGNFTRGTFKQVVTVFRTVVPDLHVSMDETVAEGDWLAGRLIYTGTFKESISKDNDAMKPTGKPILFVINVFVRFNKDGIGIQDYKEYNRLAWLQQLGILPPSS
jgi:predicted ester cyclase